MTYKIHSCFTLLFLGLVAWLICLPLFQDGMFMDGVQYAAIARNLAKGIGSFWFPVLSQNSVAGLDTFHEHPPLVFFLQAQFFKWFGTDHIYPERVYCLITFLITATFMALTWWEYFEKEKSVRQMWWLPLILWMTMPIVWWSYANNIHENTMAVFTTAAVYFFLRAIKSPNALLDINFYAASLLVFLATLSKGVPGLFPLAFFLIQYFVFRKDSFLKTFFYMFSSISLLFVSYFVVLQNPEAASALHTWFFERMLKRIASDPVVTNRFSVLAGLLLEQLPAILIGICFFLLFRRKKAPHYFNGKPFLFFLLIGLSGSVPLMLTLVQRNFYFVPALPWFAFAWAVTMANGLSFALEKLKPGHLFLSNLNILATVIFISGCIVTIYKAGDIKRDKEMLRDVYTLQKIVPENSFVSVTSDLMWMNWSFRCYMIRYDAVSFSTGDTCNYFIAYPHETIPSTYSKVNAPLKTVALYRKNNYRVSSLNTSSSEYSSLLRCMSVRFFSLAKLNISSRISLWPCETRFHRPSLSCSMDFTSLIIPSKDLSTRCLNSAVTIISLPIRF